MPFVSGKSVSKQFVSDDMADRKDSCGFRNLNKVVFDHSLEFVNLVDFQIILTLGIVQTLRAVS